MTQPKKIPPPPSLPPSKKCVGDNFHARRAEHSVLVPANKQAARHVCLTFFVINLLKKQPTNEQFPLIRKKKIFLSFQCQIFKVCFYLIVKV